MDGILDVNDSGYVVWPHDFSGDAHHVELFLYDGISVEQITNNGYANQLPRINAVGQIVWTRYDFSVSPSTSKIMLYSNGATTELSGNTLRPQVSDINDAGDVVWGSESVGIEMWDGRKTVVITDDGYGPRINNNGDIGFVRFDEGAGKWAAWLYRGGEFFQLSDLAYSSATLNLNDRGEVVWRSIVNEVGDTGVFMMRKIPEVPTISFAGFVVMGGLVLVLGPCVLMLWGWRTSGEGG